MPASFHGVGVVGEREYEIDVWGHPGRRIVIVVNGKTVFDKRPFLPRNRVEFRIEERLAVLEWRTAGFMWQDCYVTLGTHEFMLQERDSTGQPLSAGRRSELITIISSVGAILLGLFILILNYYALRASNEEFVNHLVITPLLLVGGATALILRRKMASGPRLPGDPRLYAVGLFLTLIIGWWLMGWFVDTFYQ